MDRLFKIPNRVGPSPGICFDLSLMRQRRGTFNGGKIERHHMLQ